LLITGAVVSAGVQSTTFQVKLTGVDRVSATTWRQPRNDLQMAGGKVAIHP
jgi:hypothetical protein